ncbi:MAG: GIY-YIG nuclease family protein [Thermomicrobiales bacterium]|nr:GIY-YIG nuclease family protein [Thermomicrobiales bacterium]
MSHVPDLTCWVYILTNRSGTLYIGCTSNLPRRLWEHQQGQVPGFTAQYRITRLIYAEQHPTVRDAMGREQQLKKWSRAKKVALIAQSNPEWEDLGAEWFGLPAPGH